MNIDFNNIGDFCLVRNSSKNFKQGNDELNFMNFDEILKESLGYIDKNQNTENFEIENEILLDEDVEFENPELENQNFENEICDTRENYEVKDNCEKPIQKSDVKDLNENYVEENVEDVEDDENFENLKSLVYILDLVCVEHDNHKNVFDFSKSDFDSEKFSDLNKINEESLSKILRNFGCDTILVENKNISSEEVLNQIFNDTENFKMILRNEIIKFEEKEFDNSILKILDSGNFLEDEELLKNLKSEIASKLNESIFVSEKSSIPEYTFDKFLAPKNSIEAEVSKDTEVLKEIYGDTDLSKNIENYYVNAVRNNELSNVNFEKIIDGSNPKKFEKEFVETVKFMSTKGKSEMSIKITPDHLGKIDIKYEVTKNNVRVVIRAERNEAIKLIDNTVAQIKNMVKENHQIDLKNIYVDVGQFEFGSGSKENSKQEHGQNKNGKANNMEIESDLISDNGNDLRSGVLV